MFSLRDFIKKGLIESIGKEPNYKVIMNTVGWLDKGVLEEIDVEEINSLLYPTEDSEITETTEPAETINSESEE